MSDLSVPSKIPKVIEAGIHAPASTLLGPLVPGPWSLVPYQTTHPSAETIGCPFLHPNAFAKASKFCTVPLVRNRPGECGSTCAATRAYCGRTFSHHICANDRKNLWSGVKPSIFLPLCAGLSLASTFCSARYAIRRPPLSAVFSPSVSLPFRCCPGTGSKLSYSFTSQAVRLSNAALSCGVHQFFKLPCASNLLPWSSKPWVISWPITTPIAPKFTAASFVASKNGGCRIPAGKLMSLLLGS